jgi:hypothetical protein
MIDSCWYENDVTDQEAEFYLAGNWELLEDALDEFGITDNPIKHGAAWCDSVIREYVLPMAIDMVLDEMEEEE